jgi:hypothetical protein
MRREEKERKGAERKGERRKDTDEKKRKEGSATSTLPTSDSTPAEPNVVATYATVPARIAAVATDSMT